MGGDGFGPKAMSQNDMLSGAQKSESIPFPSMPAQVKSPKISPRNNAVGMGNNDNKSLSGAGLPQNNQLQM